MEATANVATVTNPTLFTVIRGGELFAPEALGQKEILISGPRILAIGEGFADKTAALGFTVSAWSLVLYAIPITTISVILGALQFWLFDRLYRRQADRRREVAQ